MMKFLLCGIFLTCGCAAEPIAEEEPVVPKGVATLVEQLLGKKGGDRLFYFPTKTAPDLPSKYGLAFEHVTFKSEDGTKLTGWFLKPKAGVNPKGTVVFHHGNTGAMGYHIPFVSWMVEDGYQVLLYDYRGYGKSEGALSRKGMVEDARAALTYVRTRKDVNAQKLISFGHSLGGAKSLAALGEKMVPGVRGVVSFAGFASYQDMANRFAGKAGVDLVTDDYSAVGLIAKISPVPVLLVHGSRDRTVPFAQGEKLFKAAKEPKTFYEVKGGGHTRALSMNNGKYRKKVLAWMAQVLKD